MIADPTAKPVKTTAPLDWCVEWFGSQGDFIAGKATEAVPLERFSGLEGLFAVGPLENGRGEVSIFDSTPLISMVQDDAAAVVIDDRYRAGFLVYAIVENWRRCTLGDSIDREEQFERELVNLAVEGGIDTDEPFPFLLFGHVRGATLHVLCNRSDAAYNPELHEQSKVRFKITNESVEVIGFYSRNHRGIFTPRDSNLHMHVRTLDNRMCGHLEGFDLPQGMMLYLPANER